MTRSSSSILAWFWPPTIEMFFCLPRCCLRVLRQWHLGCKAKCPASGLACTVVSPLLVCFVSLLMTGPWFPGHHDIILFSVLQISLGLFSAVPGAQLTESVLHLSASKCKILFSSGLPLDWWPVSMVAACFSGLVWA